MFREYYTKPQIEDASAFFAVEFALIKDALQYGSPKNRVAVEGRIAHLRSLLPENTKYRIWLEETVSKFGV